MYPEVLQQLIEAFKILPGVGEKTAERYALSLLDIPDEEIENMASSLTRLKKELHYCKECGNLTDQDISDPGDGWGRSWGPGASLSYMEILAGPRAVLPTLPECKVGRPSADGRNAL